MPKSYQCGRWVGFGGWMGVVVWVVGAQDFRVSPWHFENGASSKNDDVLTDGQVWWPILDHYYFLNFFVGPLLHA